MEKVEHGYSMENEDGSIDVPLFYGDDPEEWISWVESYGSVEGFSDFQMMQFTYGFIEGEALAWYHEETSRSSFSNWEELKTGILQRFGEIDNQECFDILREIKQVILELKQLRSEDSDSKQRGTETNQTEANPVVQIVESESCLDGKVNSVEVLSKRKDENSQMYSLQILDGKLSHEEQSAEPKSEDVDMAKHACQVFDQMPIRGKKNVKKKKRRRWKKLSKMVGPTSCFKRSGVTDCVEMLAKRTDLIVKIYSPQVLEEKLNYEAQFDKPKKTGVKMWQNTHQVFDKMIKKRKRRKKKKINNSKRSNYAGGKVNSWTFRIQMKNIHDSPDTTGLVSCTGENYHLRSTGRVFDRRLLWLFTKKKKKKKKTRIGSKVDSPQMLKDVPLSRIRRATRKKTNWVKKKTRSEIKAYFYQFLVVMLLCRMRKVTRKMTFLRKWKKRKVKYIEKQKKEMNVMLLLLNMGELLDQNVGMTRRKKKSPKSAKIKHKWKKNTKEVVNVSITEPEMVMGCKLRSKGSFVKKLLGSLALEMVGIKPMEGNFDAQLVLGDNTCSVKVSDMESYVWEEVKIAQGLFLLANSKDSSSACQMNQRLIVLCTSQLGDILHVRKHLFSCSSSQPRPF